MFNNIFKLITFIAITTVTVGCANTKFGHDYLMRGQVVVATDSKVIVCVGYRDGAEIGQKLNAYRFFYTNTHGEGGDTYERQNVGVVEIVKIIDEHYAKVKILEGKVTIADMVQLDK